MTSKWSSGPISQLTGNAVEELCDPAALPAKLVGARIIVKTADGATWPTTVREVGRRAAPVLVRHSGRPR